MEALDNDELIVVIVGDEDDNEERTEAKQEVICKQEIPDGTEEIPVDYLIETAEKYGKPIEIGNLKEEPEEYVNEYVDDVNDEDYIQDFSDEYSDEEYNVNKKSQKTLSSSKTKLHRNTMRAPHEQQSFVNQLRKRHPELAADKELLINTLSHIMVNVKRPDPPKDFFIMNSIMFECVECGTKSDTMPAASRHWQEKHGPRYLICYACGVDFRSTTNLYKHEKRCNAPDAVIVLKARARTLGRKGRGRPFLVTTRIRKLDYLDGKKKRFSCSYCSAEFWSKQSLQSHEFKHTGVRPFRCKQCPAAYTSACGLARHSVKHTDIQFICDDCGRSFKCKNALIVHLDTHKPLRRFPCPECGRRFAQKMAMRLHEDRVHRNLPPPCACQVCPKRYPRMSLLKAHMLRDHGMNLITRKMFYKSLPMLSVTQLAQAKIVLKSELAKPETEESQKNSTNSQTKHIISKAQDGDYEKEIKEEANLPLELMQCIQNMANGQMDSDSKYIVIQNGEAIYVDGNNIGFYKNNQVIAEVEAELEQQLEGQFYDEDDKEEVRRQIAMQNETGPEEILCETSGLVVRQNT